MRTLHDKITQLRKDLYVLAATRTNRIHDLEREIKEVNAAFDKRALQITRELRRLEQALPKQSEPEPRPRKSRVLRVTDTDGLTEEEARHYRELKNAKKAK